MWGVAVQRKSLPPPGRDDHISVPAQPFLNLTPGCSPFVNSTPATDAQLAAGELNLSNLAGLRGGFRPPLLRAVMPVTALRGALCSN